MFRSGCSGRELAQCSYCILISTVFRSFEPFRAVLASTDCKKCYYKQKQIFCNKFNIDTTNAEFDADFEKKLKTVHEKKDYQKPVCG